MDELTKYINKLKIAEQIASQLERLVICFWREELVMQEDKVEIYHYYDKGEWIPIYFNNNPKMGKEWNKLCQRLMLQNAIPNRLTYKEFIEEMELKNIIAPNSQKDL